MIFFLFLTNIRVIERFVLQIDLHVLILFIIFFYGCRNMKTNYVSWTMISSLPNTNWNIMTERYLSVETNVLICIYDIFYIEVSKYMEANYFIEP